MSHRRRMISALVVAAMSACQVYAQQETPAASPEAQPSSKAGAKGPADAKGEKAAKKSVKKSAEELAAQAAVDAAQEDILEKWSKYSAVSAAITMDREILRGPYRTSSTMLGQFDYLKKDGKALFREEYHSSQSQNLEEKEVFAVEQSTLMYGDGEFVFTLSDGTSGKALFKNKQTPHHIIVDSRAIIERMNRAYNIKLLPEGIEQSEPVYVFEAVRKLDADKESKRSTLRFFSKKTGILLKRIAIDEDGAVTSTLRLRSINTSPTFAPDHFKFVKPEGLSITDNTKK